MVEFLAFIISELFGADWMLQSQKYKKKSFNENGAGVPLSILQPTSLLLRLDIKQKKKKSIELFCSLFLYLLFFFPFSNAFSIYGCGKQNHRVQYECSDCRM